MYRGLIHPQQHPACRFHNAGGIAARKGAGSALIEYCYTVGTTELSAVNVPNVLGAISVDAGITQSRNFYYDIYRNAKGGNEGTGSTKVGVLDIPGMFYTSLYINAGWDFVCENANGTSDIWKRKNLVNDGYPTLWWDGDGYSDNCKTYWGVNSDWNHVSNWTPGSAPATGEGIYFRADATYNPTVPANLVLSTLIFENEDDETTRLIIGNNNLTVNKIIGGGEKNFVRTDGNGRVLIAIPDGGSATFHVGRGGYSPVTITNNTGVADVFGVSVLDTIYADGVGAGTFVGAHINRTYNIEKNNGNGGAGVDIKFGWRNDEYRGTFISPAVIHHNGSAWEKFPENNWKNIDSLTILGYTGTFSPFSIGENSTTLPVSWGSFNVVKQGDASLLKWSTLNEENAKYYFVQHSTNARDWTTLGTVAAAGNSNETQDYQYLHNNPANGINYYRILQQDVDGRQNISKVVSLQWISKINLLVYPNPATAGKIQVDVKQTGTLQFFSNTGALVKQVKVNSGLNTIDISMLANGIYVLLAGDESTTLIVK